MSGQVYHLSNRHYKTNQTICIGADYKSYPGYQRTPDICRAENKHHNLRIFCGDYGLITPNYFYNCIVCQF